MADFTFDEKAGGIALIVAGLSGFLSIVNGLGFGFIRSHPHAYGIPLLVVGLGVYVLLRWPFNNLVLLVGGILAMLNLIGLAFGFGIGPGNFSGLVPSIVFFFPVLVGGIIALLAAGVDALEGIL